LEHIAPAVATREHIILSGLKGGKRKTGAMVVKFGRERSSGIAVQAAEEFSSN